MSGCGLFVLNGVCVYICVCVMRRGDSNQC